MELLNKLWYNFADKKRLLTGYSVTYFYIDGDSDKDIGQETIEYKFKTPTIIDDYDSWDHYIEANQRVKKDKELTEFHTRYAKELFEKAKKEKLFETERLIFDSSRIFGVKWRVENGITKELSYEQYKEAKKDGGNK